MSRSIVKRARIGASIEMLGRVGRPVMRRLDHWIYTLPQSHVRRST
jgi:hypothetical protein